jgi:hypothetical protein
VKLLMANRGRPGQEEAEPLVVDVVGSSVLLVLDDGEQVELDLGELRNALDPGTEVEDRGGRR